MGLDAATFDVVYASTHENLCRIGRRLLGDDDLAATIGGMLAAPEQAIAAEEGVSHRVSHACAWSGVPGGSRPASVGES